MQRFEVFCIYINRCCIFADNFYVEPLNPYAYGYKIHVIEM